LIVRVWQRVTELGVFDKVVVATDSEEIEHIAAEHGAEVVLTGEHNSGTERAAWVVQHGGYANYEAIVNVQGDEPFVSRRALMGATRKVTDAGFAIGTAAVSASPDVLGDPNVVKVVTNDRGRAMYFSRAPIPFLRDAADAELLRSQVYQHIGVYAYSMETLWSWPELPYSPLEHIERLEQLRPLAAGIEIGVDLIDEPVRPGIDTEEDLERANRHWTLFSNG
jgi:3-deoxy-manno-octulosonate cytidylyltransferase (CMP-KDO synthetase)